MVLFMKILPRLASVFALAILTTSAASASETCDLSGHGANRVAISPAQVAGRYVLDKKASRMEFCVSHFPFSEVRGNFAEFEGGFVIPPTALERSHVDVVLEPASVDTRSKIIDRMVTGEEFFDVQRYPEIRFVSTGIQLTGNGKARLTGELTLLGVSRPASFDVSYAFEEFDPKTPEREMTFCATSEISRSDFGMEGLPGVVSDKIRLRVRGVGRRIATIADVRAE
jgi:polyisoprenoid-binding protein YceI